MTSVPNVVSEVRALAMGLVADPLAGADADPARNALTAAPGLAYFEELEDAIVRFDSQRRVVYANPAWERATAASRWQFIGHRLGDVQSFAECAPMLDAALADSLQTHDGRWLRLGVAHPTGRKSFDVRLQVEPGVEPEYVHITAIFRDVTASTTPAPNAVDQIAQTLVTGVRIGLCLLDGRLSYRVWNDPLEELLGVPAAQVLGRSVRDTPGLAALTGLIDDLERMAASPPAGPLESEYRLPDRTGSGPAWVRVKRTPVTDLRGQFDGVFVTVERIDRERFAENSLVDLRQALESVGEMVFELNRDGVIVDVNETALSVLGYERETLCGTSLATIEVAAPGTFEAVYDQLLTRGTYAGDSTYRTRLGALVPVEVVLRRIEQAGREFILLLARDASERRRSENVLTESAERFRALFDESPVAILLLDAQTRIIGVNPAASETLGYAADDLLGRDFESLVHLEDVAAYRSATASLQGGGVQVDTAERRLMHSEGRVVWTKVNLRATAAGEGQRHYLVVLENFTDRKIFEEQLQVALRDQQTLFETMSVGVAQAMSGKILLANREFAEMFGYSDGQVIGMPLWDLTIDRHNRMPNELSGMPVVRASRTTRAEVVLFTREGEPKWCLVQARPIEAQEPGLEVLSVAIYTFQDITEMKRQREALSRSLVELNVVLDATSTGVLHLADDRIIRGNAQAQLLFGHSGADVAGATFSSLFVSETDLQDAMMVLKTQLATRRPASFEALMRGAEGNFWGLVSLRALDASAGARGLIASILDISERKQQEEELQTALAQQQLIFDTALVGLLFVREGRPVRANAAMEELLACDPGGLISQMQLFSHPTDHLLLAGLAEHFERINEAGACEFELHMYRRKGEPIWVAVQGRAVSSERSDAGYIFAFVDIDKRKRSERELRSTLNELQLIFDNALVSMLYVANDLIVKANAATEHLFGYDARDYSELVMSSLFALPADWEQISAEVAETPADGNGHSFELLMRRSDGTTFWCAGNGRPIEPGAPERGLILTLMDVDARRRSEEELRRVRNYLDLVVEHLPVLVSVREAETGRFVSLNRAGESITGLSRSQVVGRTWREVYTRQFADLYAELDKKALTTGAQVDRPRDVMLRADGKRLTVNQRVVPMFEPGPGVESHPRYVMSIIDDLTEEVRAET
ncbi:MAG: PAS domain S-box protein, partial [Burkholderiaceae bacterium]